MTVAWFAVAGVAAAGDWVAVARGHRRLEWLCKPAVVVCLLLAALTLDPVDATRRAWFVGALAASLAGDLALMVPEQRDDAGAAGADGRVWFIAGLVMFLAAHLAYIAGFVAQGVAPRVAAPTAAIAVACAAALFQRLVWGLRRRGEQALIAPVGLYSVVLVAMVAAAVGSGSAVAAGGGVLFMVSDATLAWGRFVGPLAHGRLLVHVTYHLAQGLLVASLLV